MYIQPVLILSPEKLICVDCRLYLMRKGAHSQLFWVIVHLFTALLVDWSFGKIVSQMLSLCVSQQKVFLFLHQFCYYSWAFLRFSTYFFLHVVSKSCSLQLFCAPVFLLHNWAFSETSSLQDNIMYCIPLPCLFLCRLFVPSSIFNDI